nr:hypothetical protein [Tanacetum cinerariifolium]
MKDVNPIRTLRDYSKPSHEGCKNIIKLPIKNNVVPLRFDTIRTAKFYNDILMFQQHKGESLSEAWTRFKQTIDQSVGGKLCDMNAKESWALLEDLALCDNESWNDPRDFAKPVKAIFLPQDVPSTFDRHLIKLKNQVQRLMEAHLAPMQPTQREISGTLSNPSKKILVTPTIRHGKVTQTLGLVSDFMASQDARLSKFEADFKQQQSEITNKIETVLKAITDQMAGALPSDMVTNPKLSVNSTTPVFPARSYPTKDPQYSTHTHGLINTIVIYPKQQSNARDSKAKEEEQEREGNLKDTNAIAHNEDQRDTPQLELKDITDVDNLWPNRDDEEIEWLEVEEPLDLVDKSEESVYELLIKEMPKCSLNYDFRIEKDDTRNLKIPCMIGHKFTANAYIDVDLPMNIMSLAYYNSIRKNGYQYRGRNFV